jgi:hypothetical protein
MNLKAFATCGVILIGWSIALGEILQKTHWLDYVTELAVLGILVIGWICWILAPLNLGDWKTNLGEWKVAKFAIRKKRS